VGGEHSGGVSDGGAAHQAGAAGHGDAGAPATPECETAKDCDDSIDCTTDACEAGVCSHTPDDKPCDATHCETCQAGIGCVAGPQTTTELLLDPNFDDATGDWDESGSDVKNIVANAQAQSGSTLAKLGPALPKAVKQQYSDLFQSVTIPAGVVALNLKGYYKLAPGVKLPADDYAVAALYELAATQPFMRFHDWNANTAQATWKAFSYDAPKAKLAQLSGNDYTFDFVAEVWDSVYQFDTLSLSATVCQ
jgi:hypothetical protein